MNGKGFYVFKDEKAGVAYIGGESAHQRYQQLCTQQHVAQASEEDMNHPSTRVGTNDGARAGYGIKPTQGETQLA